MPATCGAARRRPRCWRKSRGTGRGWLEVRRQTSQGQRPGLPGLGLTIALAVKVLSGWSLRGCRWSADCCAQGRRPARGGARVQLARTPRFEGRACSTARQNPETLPCDAIDTWRPWQPSSASALTGYGWPRRISYRWTARRSRQPDPARARRARFRLQGQRNASSPNPSA